MPFAHHDVVCHLKGSTHCNTLLRGIVRRAAARSRCALSAGSRCDAGSAILPPAACCHLQSRPRPSVSGRAPPAYRSDSFSPFHPVGVRSIRLVGGPARRAEVIMWLACRTVSVARAGACALVVALSASPALPSRRPAAPSAEAQEMRQELERLRQEFEAIRDSYGARLAALEAKLAGIARRGAGGARRRPRTTPAPAADVRRRRRCGGQPAGRRRRRAAGLRQRCGDVEGLQPRHGRHRQLRRRRRRERRRPDARRSQLNEAEATFQAVVDPYARADFFLAVLAGRGGDRGRLHHVHDAARRPAREGRQDEGAVRQGQHAARPRAAVGRRAAR